MVVVVVVVVDGVGLGVVEVMTATVPTTTTTAATATAIATAIRGDEKAAHPQYRTSRPWHRLHRQQLRACSPHVRPDALVICMTAACLVPLRAAQGMLAAMVVVVGFDWHTAKAGHVLHLCSHRCSRCDVACATSKAAAMTQEPWDRPHTRRQCRMHRGAGGNSAATS